MEGCCGDCPYSIFFEKHKIINYLAVYEKLVIDIDIGLLNAFTGQLAQIFLPRLNIKSLRPWDKGILLQELVADRDEREAQRRFAVPGTSGRRRGAESPLETRRPRPWDEAVRTKRRMENPPQEPPNQRRTGLRRDAESPLDEDDRSNQNYLYEIRCKNGFEGKHTRHGRPGMSK